MTKSVKITLSIIVSLVAACAILFLCLFLIQRKSTAENKKTSVTDIHVPDPEKLSLTVSDDMLLEEEPMLILEWKNLDTKDFSYGQNFSLYEYSDGQYTKHPDSSKLAFGLVLYVVKPGEARTEYCNLSLLTLEQGKSYRLYLNTFETSDYWIDFTYGVLQ